MSPTPAVLAALADAAVSGLRPQRVQGVAERLGDRHHVAFVEDDRSRQWVVRLPDDAVSAARQDASSALLDTLPGYLPFEVPRPSGFAALPDGRRAMIYPLLPGQLLDFAMLPAGPGITSEIGRALATLHDLDHRIVEESGLPVYEAEECRRRLQGEVDRGARTGLVPTGLLARWERALDDVSWWRFAPCTVHGYLANRHLLAAFDDDDTGSGRVAALLSWEGATVGDPAEDLASFSRAASPEAVRTLFDSYTRHRRGSVDPHLRERAELLGELRLLSRLLQSRSRQDPAELDHAVENLQRLDDLLGDAAPPADRSDGPAGMPLEFDAAPIDEQWYSSPGGPGPRPAPDSQKSADTQSAVDAADSVDAADPQTPVGSARDVEDDAPAHGPQDRGPR